MYFLCISFICFIFAILDVFRNGERTKLSFDFVEFGAFILAFYLVIIKNIFDFDFLYF